MGALETRSLEPGDWVRLRVRITVRLRVRVRFRLRVRLRNRVRVRVRVWAHRLRNSQASLLQAPGSGLPASVAPML